MIPGRPRHRRLPCRRLLALAAFAAASLVIAAPGLVADRLELDNGDVVSGTIVGIADGTVTIRTDYGTLEIPRERVVRGVFGADAATEPGAAAPESAAATGSANGRSGDETADRDGGDAETDDRSALIFRFPLDGSLVDATGRFTLVNNGMEYVPDVSGAAERALRSDGSGTYASIAPAPVLDELDAFTLVFLVRLESVGPTRYLVSKWDRAEGETADGKFTIQTSSGGLTFFLVGPDGRYHWLSARGVIEPNTWHAVAVSFSAGQAAIHVDGAEVARRTFAFTELAADDSPLLFMTAEADTDDPYGYYNAVGSVDELRLYGRALTAEEITLLSAPDADG